MKVTLKNLVDPNVFDCNNPKPGVYKSAKGSILIKPENNVTTRGNVGSQDNHVLIWDVDTKKTIGKLCSDVKGEYTFVAPLSNVELVVNGGKCGCPDRGF
jgi:hypothetical protein